MRFAAAVFLLLGSAFAQAPATLGAIVTALNAAAPAIQTVVAEAHVTDFTAFVSDTSRTSGMLYFERNSKSPRYSLNLTEPADAAKRLVIRDKTAWVYTPAAKQVMKYLFGDKQDLANEFLLLGIGASGAELARDFTLTLAPPQTLQGQSTVCLNLVPRAASTAVQVPKIELCYDPATWVAVLQQIWRPGGDYHRLELRNVQLNAKISGSAFSTDFHGAVVVTPGND